MAIRSGRVLIVDMEAACWHFKPRSLQQHGMDEIRKYM